MIVGTLLFHLRECIIIYGMLGFAKLLIAVDVMPNRTIYKCTRAGLFLVYQEDLLLCERKCERTPLRRIVVALIVTLLLSPVGFMCLPETDAAFDSAPFTPHQVKVLVVSPNYVYFKGGHYLIADLARYGFNVTQHASDSGNVTDYLVEPKTANLAQYDVVILHGSYLGIPPTSVALEELRHFTNYGGVLVVIGNALFIDQSSGTLWNDFFYSEPLMTIETRLGVAVLDYLKNYGASYDHNNGTFSRISSLIPDLPESLYYMRGSYHGSQYQMKVDPTEAEVIYQFTTQNGISTSGVTFFMNATGAVGIYVQGSYVYAEQPGTNQINYLGLVDNSERPQLLASLIAHALGKDIGTVIKPQPLANVRLDGLGSDARWDQPYLDASLGYFDAVLDAFNITPTVAFTDVPQTFEPDYWQRIVPSILKQLEGKYRDWEYSSSMRNQLLGAMSQNNIETLIDGVRSSYSSLGMDLFSTIIPRSWSEATLWAMASRNLYLLDQKKSTGDWWKLRVDQSIVLHEAAALGSSPLYENFTQINSDISKAKDTLHFEYVSSRDQWALAVLNGFPGYVYNVRNFRRNEVGTYSLQTVYRNLSSEIPDIRFVPLIEAGLYFGNKWVRVQNAWRSSSVIEFDVDTSAIPTVVSIDKGMIWLRINANDTIQEVSVDGVGWSYFDSNSIRIPAAAASVHVKVTLGTSNSPRIVESRFKVVRALFDGYRLNVSITSTPALNVSLHMLIPQTGRFAKDNWNVFCLEAEWNYNFTFQSRLLKLWAISDGVTNFEVGVLWIIEHTSPSYDADVTVSANFSALESTINEAILSYNASTGWKNDTMASQSEFYTAVIPKMPYGTVVNYKLFVSINTGMWFTTETFSYAVIDNIAPEIDVVDWNRMPLAGQPAEVQFSVTEPPAASGVKSVTLYYFPGTSVLGSAQAKPIEMINKSGIWTAEIPGQSGGSVISFSVIAIDNAENRVQTSLFTYTVSLLPIPLPLFVVLLGVVIAVAVGSAWYLLKFRKAKSEVAARQRTADA